MLAWLLLPLLSWSSFASAFVVPTTIRSSIISSRSRRSALDSDSFDMEELKQRIYKETNPLAHLFGVTNCPHTEQVFVIGFDSGIHSIEYPKGSGNNYVLAFESLQACDNFALRLRDQQFFDPEPQRFDFDALSEFCDQLGVSVQMVPHGVELLPPTQSVEDLGKHNDRSLKEQQQRLEELYDWSDDDDVVEEEDGLIFGASAFE